MNGKRIISSLLSLAMVFSLNTGMSFAEEAEQPVDEPVVEEQVVTEEPAAEDPAPVEEETEEPTVEVTEEEAAEEEVEAEEEYPANTFTGVTPDGKISVEVIAGEGALPAGAAMRVENVNTASIEGLVNSVIDGEADSMTAVNIIFTDTDGNEVEPKTEIIVNIKMTDFDAADSYELVHIDQANNAKKIGEEKIIDLNNKEASFAADVFSIYAVIGEGEGGDKARLTVTFYNGDTQIDQMFVKNGDTLDDIKTIVYDPGIGTVPAGHAFIGWTTEKDYTDETTPMTIEDVRTYIDGLTIKEGDKLDLYAMVVSAFTITYLNEYEAVIKSETLKYTGDVASIDYPVEAAYTPIGDHAFEGWNVFSGEENIKIDGQTPVGTIKNGTTATITGNVTFSVNAPAGYWLVFNSDKGTYVAPQFVKTEGTDTETHTQEPIVDMKKNGYTFGGWYTEPEGKGDRFEFGGTISERTEIYAYWIPNTTAEYTIIIWKQNVNDKKDAAESAKTYDFAEVVTGTGAVGLDLATKVTGNADDKRITVDGKTKTYPGFHYAKKDSSKTITPAGANVYNVYFDRDLVTLTFLYRSNNRWQTETTMTGLYGSSLSSNNYTWPTNRDWYDDYDTWGGEYYGTGTRTTFLDAFILSSGATSQTFYGFSHSGNSTVHWQKRNEDGTYSDTNTATLSSGPNASFYITDKYNGYKAVKYRIDNGSWHTLGDKDSEGIYETVTGSYSNLYICYDPVTYKILYQDGRYFDGEGNHITTQESRGTLGESVEIPYESDISSYKKGGDNYYTPSATDGFVFDGWYIDEACTVEYEFKTMPEGINVYAKWTQIQYRVFLHPNVPTSDTTLNWGTSDQGMSFRRSYGDKISLPTGLRADYEFVGWFTDEACTNLYAADTEMNETTVTTAYDQKQSTELDVYGNPTSATNKDAENNRYWITKKFDLYAKWRAKLDGAKGIKVVYDAVAGTNPPKDTSFYLDSTQAVGGAASTAPGDKKFQYWVLQTWDSTTNAYVDKKVGGKLVVVYPGDDFTVLKADAREQEGSTVEGDTKTYTVQLRAEYVDGDIQTRTHIDWLKNDPTKDHTEEYKDDESKQKAEGIHKTGLKINEAIDIVKPAEIGTVDGYEFIGWAKDPDAKGGMFLTYHSDGSWTTADGKKVTQVAADEIKPYDYLYAIWDAVVYVYHSSTADIESVSIADLKEAGYKLNMLERVDTTGYRYGGTYKSYDGKGVEYTVDVAGNRKSQWKFDEAETTDNGIVTVDPKKDIGRTYYLKEVPNAYLNNYEEAIFKQDTRKVVNLFAMSAVDDLNYKQAGFIITDKSGNQPARVVQTFTFKNDAGTKTYKRVANTIFAKNGVKNDSYITWLNIKEYCKENATFTIQPYWITPDNVEVRGSERSINMSDLVMDNIVVSGN